MTFILSYARFMLLFLKKRRKITLYIRNGEECLNCLARKSIDWLAVLRNRNALYLMVWMLWLDKCSATSLMCQERIIIILKGKYRQMNAIICQTNWRIWELKSQIWSFSVDINLFLLLELTLITCRSAQIKPRTLLRR